MLKVSGEHIPMPRLTNQRYLKRHRFLKQAWQEIDSLFTVLTFNQQWDVHAYYKPSKDMTDEELIAHRRAITKERPSLPTKASKLYNRLRACYRVATNAAQGDEHKLRMAIAELGAKTHDKNIDSDSKIRIRTLANPEPDFRQLARALLMLEEDLRKSGRLDEILKELGDKHKD